MAEETYSRDRKIYDALAEAANRALDATFDRMAKGESLRELVEESKQEVVGAEGTASAAEMRAFVTGIIHGLDETAAHWQVDAHPAYLRAKDETVANLMKLTPDTPNAMQKAAEELNFLRSFIMKLKIETHEQDVDTLRLIGEDFVNAFSYAREDPAISEAYEELAKTVMNPTSTITCLNVVLERFREALPQFQATSQEFMETLVSQLESEAESFGVAESPELRTFFQEVRLQLSVATRPAEYMAVAGLLEQLEPVVMDKVMAVGDLDDVRALVTGLVENVAEARKNGVVMSEHADEMVDFCFTQLKDEGLQRQDYKQIMDGLRSIRMGVVGE